MRWGILLGAVVVVAACGGKSNSDDDDSGGQSSDAGKGGDAATGQGGSRAARGGGSATGGTLSSGGMPATGGTLSTGGTTGGTLSTGGTTGGTVGTGATGGSVDAMCTDLPTTVPATQMVYGGASTPPSPQGGTIQSGMYYLALETYYGAATECQDVVTTYESLGVSLMEVIRFTAQSNSAGSVEVLSQLSQGGVTPTRVTGAATYSTSGSGLSVVTTCGDAMGTDAPVGFSASGDQLVLFSTTQELCTPITATFQKL